VRRGNSSIPNGQIASQMMGLRQPSLSLAENAFDKGAKSQDVILSADVPGRHSSTTRQRRQCHLLT